MEFEKIKELIELLQGTNISEFEYEDEKAKIAIRTNEYQNEKEVIVQPAMIPAMGGMPMAPMAPAAPVAPVAPVTP